MFTIKKGYENSVVHVRVGSGLRKIKLSTATESQLKFLADMNYPFVKKKEAPKPKKEQPGDK